MSASHAFALFELRRERARALAAFDAIMQEASDAALETVLVAFERSPEYVLQGNWRGAPWKPDAEPRVRACPLSVLALGHVPDQPDEVEEAARITERRLAPHGLRAASFWGPWNARLIPVQALACRVSAHLTWRILKGRQL